MSEDSRLDKFDITEYRDIVHEVYRKKGAPPPSDEAIEEEFLFLYECQQNRKLQ